MWGDYLLWFLFAFLIFNNVDIFLCNSFLRVKNYIGHSVMISLHFQGKPFNITVIQVYVPTTDAEEAEVDQFHEDLQDLLELRWKKKKKRCPFHHRGPECKSISTFIIGDWTEKVRSQEISGLTSQFGLGVQNEAGQRLTEFCWENTLVIANTLFQQH